MHEITKFVCFICMQPHQVKFESVQINVKQVSCMNINGVLLKSPL